MMTADNGMVAQWQTYLGNLAMSRAATSRRLDPSEVYRCQGGNQQLARRLVDAIGAARG